MCFTKVKNNVLSEELRCRVHRAGLLSIMASLLVTTAFSNAFAVVVIRDGFGDGDRNNNGLAFETNDGELGIEGDITGDYLALGGGGSPLVFPEGTMVIGATTPDDTSDVGIRWTSTGGITNSGAGDPAARPRIIDDTAGVMPETNASIGFFNNIAGSVQTVQALDSGLALAFEGKGRGRSISGFFETDGDYSNGKQGTISLGPKVGDEVKISFDFRVWMSAPNFNTGDTDNHIPNRGEIRFGLYQDADNQLGQVNLFAGGTGVTDAVWGEDDGGFRGDFFGPDASGDPGWFARLPIYDPDAPSNPLFGPFPDGRNARIVQETNSHPDSNTTIHLQGSSFANGGDTDVVASPDQVTPDFLTMENTKRYHIELSLRRFDETGGSTNPADDGDNIEATLSVFDIDNPGTIYSLTGFNPLDPEMLDPQAGFYSEAWDYFSITTAGSTDSDEFDFILDNFQLEVIGSNEPIVDVDLDDDGDVDGADFLLIQKTDPSLIALWQTQYGSGAPLAASTVPEPSTLVSLVASGLLAVGTRRRAYRT